MKFGVSLYSYQRAYEDRRMDLEACLRAMAAIEGRVDGLEILADRRAHCPQVGYIGTLTPADQQKLPELLARYEAKPVCYDSTMTWDTGRNLFAKLDFNRNPSEAVYREQLAYFRAEIDFAAQFGFPLLRAPMFYGVYKEVIRDSLRYARDRGVCVCCEVHAPLRIDGPLIAEYLEMVEGTCPEAGGLIPDFGIYQHAMAEPGLRWDLQRGANPELIAAIRAAHNLPEEIDGIFDRFGVKPEDEILAKTYRRAKYAPVPDDPARLREFAPWIRHVHAKFYEFDDALEERCIDFRGPLRVLSQLGYEGYVCAEFEGQICTNPAELDEVEQVRRAMTFCQRFVAEG